MALRLFALVFLGMFSSFVWAGDDQGGQDRNKTVDGKKQGKWIYFGKDRPAAGFPAEGKIEEGSYTDDRKEGLWIKYHNDGKTPKLKGEYHNNRPSGRYEKIWPNGQVKESGTFNRNKYYDSLIRFDESGQVVYEAVYNDAGREQGSVKYYYGNGQVEFEYESQNGIPTGKATRYYENGDVKEVIYYNEDGSVESSEQIDMVSPPVDSGEPTTPRVAPPKLDEIRTKGVEFKPNGYNKVYNNNDEIWQDGEFRNGGLWDGKVYEYDEDGILLRVKVFKKGTYHSDGQL
ncbi:MAG: hypothetical protein MK066_04420 [Crocinitomicaceae bacterium]|nr:hypothetical protein [Crocinitomicaceae bacterium]